MAGNEHRLDAIRRFAEACHYEQGHSEQVARLAERLFDALQPLHRLEESSRFLLSAAGLLHDIGWTSGQKAHHKQSMQRILDDTTLPLSQEERTIVALVARYHRKSLPDPSHPVYDGLSETQRGVVDRLAALLRMADGLDRSHSEAVASLSVTLNDTQVEIRCGAQGDIAEELLYGKAKADLFERVFGREAIFLKA